MKIKNNIKKTALILSVAGLGILAATSTSLAANLATPPLVINEGKEDNTQVIKNLEDSVLKAETSYQASKYLLERSPETVKGIKGDLEGKMAEAEILLSESKVILNTLKPEPENDELKDLREAYKKNLVSLQAGNMLLTSTPHTIKKVEADLRKIIAESTELIDETKALIKKIERQEANKLNPIETKTIGLYYTSPSETQVLDYWRNFKTDSKTTEDLYGLALMSRQADDLYDPQVDLASENPGRLSLDALRDINHIANTVRYSLGLPRVMVSEEKSHYAQAASVVFFLNKDYDHKPALPTGLTIDSKLYQDGALGARKSNIHYLRNSIDILKGYFNDADKTNWDTVGHRRWLINPFAESFGYGLYENYTAAYVFQDSDPSPDREVVAYPSNVGISEFFHLDAPFSFHFSDNFDVSNPNITMTDLNTGRVVKYEAGKNIVINTQNYGELNSMTWGLGLKGEQGDQYEVEIDGVTYLGEDYPINYTVNFISLEHTNK